MAELNKAASLVREAATLVRQVPGAQELAALAAPGAATQTVRFHSDLISLTPVEIEDAVVLDAGCGHGESSVVLAALGAPVVHAVDIGADEVETLRRCAEAIGGTIGAALRPARASVFGLPLESERVDLVVSNEAIGVYRELGAFLDECARVLRPGGAVVMTENNDVLNPRLRARARRLWRAYELGPAGLHDGHAIDVPYVERRAEVVRRALPDARADVVEQIAHSTFGHDARDLDAACERWASGGQMPNSPFDPERPPVDLIGMLVEAPVDPAWMKAALAGRGLVPRVSGYWGGGHRLAAVRAADRMLRALGRPALPTARAIRYTGVKPVGAATGVRDGASCGP